jgi:pyruvate-ferredoxin/flavodoxin oxidoreductase
MIVANATGCSSIYGGNLPTTPWAVNAAGEGPAWVNSLFEDNAEFGLGMRLALDVQEKLARQLLERLAPVVGEDLARGILDAPQVTEPEIVAQRERVDRLRVTLERIGGEHADDAAQLAALAGDLLRRGVWIMGGDGWAYDIGYGGLDQVLSSGRNVNILVLDTEVYSNTGGQSSKATPRGAVAKFAAAGKSTGKKDLGAVARSYGNVFVAQVAMGANDAQTIKALLEADAWPGTSLVIAYSTCIAHGIDMSKSMSHQKDAVKSGYWPLYRYQPSEGDDGQPFKLDSGKPTIPIRDFVSSETRFAILERTDPERAANLAQLAQADADERWRYYEQLAGIHRVVPHVHHDNGDSPSDDGAAAEAGTDGKEDLA